MSARRDAAANRERLLAAAVAVLHRDGARVPLSRIADEAGVGVATLYRNYPSREALLLALTERSYCLVLDAARAAADADEPAVEALGTYFARVVGARAELVLPFHGGPLPAEPRFVELRARLQEALDRLLARGRRDGTVRADLTSIDVIVAGALLVQGLDRFPDWERRALRHARIVLDGFAATGAAPLPDAPLTPDELERRFGGA